VPPGAPRTGQAFRTSRDLAAKRDAYYGRHAWPGRDDGRVPAGGPPTATGPGAERSDAEGELGGAPAGERGFVPPPAVVPGQRRYHDGDRVRHHAFGVGTVVSSRLTRDDEEVTVAFPDRGVKTLLASIANLEVLG
jgi:hypothetical protein